MKLTAYSFHKQIVCQSLNKIFEKFSDVGIINALFKLISQNYSQNDLIWYMNGIFCDPFNYFCGHPVVSLGAWKRNGIGAKIAYHKFSIPQNKTIRIHCFPSITYFSITKAQSPP